MINEPGTQEETRFACRPALFDAHLRTLRDNGYATVSPDDVARCLQEKRPLPEKSVLVTLDDGYEDNLKNALPILKKYDTPALIFLATSKLGGKNDWVTGENHPQRRLLTWDQVRAMQKEGIYLGGHTKNHPHLSQLPMEEAMQEVAGCRRASEDALDKPVHWFAYPFGDLSEETVSVVAQSGFVYACTTRSGFNNPDSDPLLLRRLEIYGSDSPRTLLRKIRFGSNEVSNRDLTRYYAGRVLARLLPRAHS